MAAKQAKKSSGLIVQTGEMVSPIGRIAVATAHDRLVMLRVHADARDLHEPLRKRFGAVAFDRARDPAGVLDRLRGYFNGQLDAIDSIEVDPGGTEFLQTVWAELRRIPVGTTRTYSELARIVGKPKAVRAVGAANAINHIAIVIPCHRVIGADGRLVGYGPGLPAKEWLLRHEGALL